MKPGPAFCHRCQCSTPTVHLRLSSGHIGNCCAVCRATRRGRPFVKRRLAQVTDPPMPEEAVGAKITHKN